MSLWKRSDIELTKIIRGTLSDIRVKVREAKITRTALVLVGRVLDGADFSDSKRTEKELTAIVAVNTGDTVLRDAAYSLFKQLPIDLDNHEIDDQNEFAKYLHGTMKDALAAAYVISS